MTPPAGSFWKVVGVFAIIGPAVGGLMFTSWLLIDRLTLSNLLIDLEQVVLLPFGVLIGYPFGAFPAFLTGAISGALSGRVTSKVAWVLLSMPVGWLFAAIMFWATGQGWVFGLFGAASALASSLIALQVRPRRTN